MSVPQKNRFFQNFGPNFHSFQNRSQHYLEKLLFLWKKQNGGTNFLDIHMFCLHIEIFEF